MQLVKNYFQPNLFIEVCKEEVSAKISGMECYLCEKRDYPHPRSGRALEILAQKRGIEIGAEYAEAFMIVRSIARV